MYTFAPKLRLAAIVLMVLGLIMFAVGFGINAGNGEEYITEYMHDHPEYFAGGGEHGEALDAHAAEEHQAHIEHMEHQYHNRPWSALYIAAFLFTGVAAVSLFFLAIQHVAQAGWSVVVTRVMEGIATFLPVGAVLMLIVLGAAALHQNHLFHWMADDGFYNFDSENFDKFLKNKEAWLNVPFWMIRSVIYLGLWSLFVFILKKKSKKLDKTGSKKDYWSLYRYSVYFIVIFALTSMASGWDWIMSLDAHWYSTLFGWYVMVSYLVTAMAIMILIAQHLKKQGALPLFNDNHLHDLTKFMFGFSLLWSYLWFAQFMLIWYANIPEETAYFRARYDLYEPTYFKMLIPNLLIPFLLLISSSIKRNYKVVAVGAVIIILGHWLDIYNQVMPATVGAWWDFGWVEFGALFFVGGLFTFVVMTALTKLNLEPKGNPLFHESEIYEYPF